MHKVFLSLMLSQVRPKMCSKLATLVVTGPPCWKATDYLDEPDCVGHHTGLTAVDAWAVAELRIGQPGGRYDPQLVTRSNE